MLFSSPSPVDDVPPPADVLAKALALPVQDASGKEHTLASIVGRHQRSVIVFVRHHHCGFCVEYVRECGANEKLKATVGSGEEGPQVIVIGHGGYEGINRYKEVSDCPFDMYVDSEKRIYNVLGLTRRFLGKTPESKEPAYFKGKSAVSLAISSVREAVGSGMLAFKGGEISLLGGEFVLEGDSKCTFAHRMKDTMDHTEVAELATLLDGPTSSATAATPLAT